MSEFNTSEAGRYAAHASQILAGAQILSEARLSSTRRLVLPMLNLAGHGLELLLKACILLNGGQPATSRGQGHDVKTMWARDDCAPVREHIFYNSKIAVFEARKEGLYPDIPQDDEVSGLIEEYILALAELHGMPRDYPLRYPANGNYSGPRSPMLPKALDMTAQDFCRNSTNFELRNLPYLPKRLY